MPELGRFCSSFSTNSGPWPRGVKRGPTCLARANLGYQNRPSPTRRHDSLSGRRACHHGLGYRPIGTNPQIGERNAEPHNFLGDRLGGPLGRAPPSWCALPMSKAPNSRRVLASFAIFKCSMRRSSSKLVAYAHAIVLPASQIIQLVLTARLSAVLPTAASAASSKRRALGAERRRQGEGRGQR